MARALPILLAGAFGVPAASAQLQWSARQLPLVYGTDMVYDPARRVLVDVSMTPQSVETHEYEASGWSLRSPAHVPLIPNSWQRVLTHDLVARRTLLFARADVWAWDGSDWSLFHQSPTILPGNAAGVFDAARGVSVILGNEGGLLRTYVFDRAILTERAPAHRPPPRHFYKLAWDQARRCVVLFGGSQNGAPMGDLWEWGGTDWTERVVTSGPSPRVPLGLTFDETRARTVLFGGWHPSTHATVRDVWEWDGTRWRVVTPGLPLPAILPEPTFDPMHYYPPLRASVLFLRGTEESNEYRFSSALPALADPLGSGCRAGVSPPATLVQQPWERPWLGDTWQIRAENLGGAGGFAFLGTSRTQWAGLTLPFSLHVSGAPFCSLYTGLEALSPMIQAGSQWRAGFPLPDDPTLLGLEVTAQALGVVPGGNALGVVLSNAAVGRVGAR